TGTSPTGAALPWGADSPKSPPSPAGKECTRELLTLSELTARGSFAAIGAPRGHRPKGRASPVRRPSAPLPNRIGRLWRAHRIPGRSPGLELPELIVGTSRREARNKAAPPRIKYA